MVEIKSALAFMPFRKPALSSYKNGSIALIVNSYLDENIGFDLTLDGRSLRITKFQREPYKTFSILSGFDNLTVKQANEVRRYLIAKYFPELHYLLDNIG